MLGLDGGFKVTNASNLNPLCIELELGLLVTITRRQDWPAKMLGKVCIGFLQNVTPMLRYPYQTFSRPFLNRYPLLFGQPISSSSL